MPLTEAQVLDALRPVQDPELHQSIVDLGMVKGVQVDGGRVGVTVALTVAGCPLRTEITNRVTDAVRPLDGVTDVAVDLTVMTDDERAALRDRMQGGHGHDHAGHDHGGGGGGGGGHEGHGHGQAAVIPFMEPGSRTRILGIASGKGGVGKSSVTVNLAIALAARGREVGVLDADVYGFSVPKMMGIAQQPVVIDQMIVPPVAHGVKVMSMGFMVDDDQPVIWRGPMLHKFLEQTLTDILWGELDYLLLDMPPGTGDVALSLSQYLPRAEVFVVTTPQAAAQRVAQRSAYMAKKLNMTVRGVVENMSWFTGDDGKRYDIFGTGGGADLAQRLGVPLVGQVPLVPALREGGDVGRPVTVVDPEGEAAAAFSRLAETVDVELAPTRIYRPELRIG